VVWHATGATWARVSAQGRPGARSRPVLGQDARRRWL